MRLRFLLLPLALAGCASAPTHFYLLEAAAPPAASSGPAATDGSPIVLRHVTIPPELDRSALVSYGPGGELTISHQNQWAAPMARMLQQVIAGDIDALRPGTVATPGDPVPSGPHRSLAVTIRHFGADSSGHMRLTADWALLGPNGARLAGSSATITGQAASADAKDVVPVMNEALSTLSHRIAQSLP